MRRRRLRVIILISSPVPELRRGLPCNFWGRNECSVVIDIALLFSTQMLQISILLHKLLFLLFLQVQSEIGLFNFGFQIETFSPIFGNLSSIFDAFIIFHSFHIN